MTRGTFYLITDIQVFYSLEFNGDMYPEGCGNNALKTLSKVKNKNDFYKTIEKFNKEHHNYADKEKVFTDSLTNLGRYKNMTKGYFDYWFSDWIFIKNIRKTDYIFILGNNKKYTLKSGETFRLNFGELTKEDK